VIDDLDRTLKKLLEQEVDVLAEEHQNVHFEVPDDKFQPARPAVDLYLYDIRENREFRTNEWLTRREEGMVTKQRAPVRIECCYLITAWAGDTYSEHLLLGKVIRALLRHSTIPAGLLQGSLAGQEPPLPTTTLQPGRLQSLGEFWQALGGKLKAALTYTVTIGIPVHEPVELGPPVTEKLIRLKQTTGET
jgi:hypothetical protein